MASLRFTRSAENDLLEAWLYVAEENPVAADRLIDRIEAESCSRNPRSAGQETNL